MSDDKQSLVVVFIVGVVLIAGFILAIIWISKQDISLPNWGGQNESKILEEKNGRLEVVGERVPDENKKRLVAPALALLPNRLPASPSNQEGIVSDERAAITKVVNDFIVAWETYNPERTRWAALNNRPDPYLQSLSQTVKNSSLNTIASREDSIDPDFACPEEDCISGSIWSGGRFHPESLTIADLEDDSAYVTTYGIVTYTGNPNSNPLAGATYLRSYGILLEKGDSGWLVERVASESVEEVNY